MAAKNPKKILEAKNRRREIFEKFKECSFHQDTSGLLDAFDQYLPQLIEVERELVSVPDEKDKELTYPDRLSSPVYPEDLLPFINEIDSIWQTGSGPVDPSTIDKKLIRELLSQLKDELKRKKFYADLQQDFWSQMRDISSLKKDERFKKARNSASRISKPGSCVRKAEAAIQHQIFGVAAIYISRLLSFCEDYEPAVIKGCKFEVTVFYRANPQQKVTSKAVNACLESRLQATVSKGVTVQNVAARGFINHTLEKEE